MKEQRCLSAWFRITCGIPIAVILMGGMGGVTAEETQPETPRKDPEKKDEAKKKDDKKIDPDKKDPKDMNLDECEAAGICPVTRMPSKLIYHVKVGEKEYHFATRDASKQFKANPGQYGYKEETHK